jgi:fructose-bisphosphate aldolase class II
MTLKEALDQASKNKVAIGHFNISDLAGLKAVTEAAHELNVPVIIGLSEGERKFVGLDEAAALVNAVRKETGQVIFLNADHTHSIEAAVAAAKAGFDSIVYDRSELDFEANIKETAEAVKQLKAINPDFIVEGEIGFIGNGSEVHAEAPKMVLTTPEESSRFIKETGVDVLAPAVGNMHGLLPSMVSGEVEKRLHLDVIEAIKTATGVPLTLHGASGTNDDDLKKAIAAGITIIHINTEIRMAWKKGLDQSLKDHPDEIAPYKVMAKSEEEVKAVVKDRLKLFNNL